PAAGPRRRPDRSAGHGGADTALFVRARLGGTTAARRLSTIGRASPLPARTRSTKDSQPGGDIPYGRHHALTPHRETRNLMTDNAPTAADLSGDIARVFALQQEHQWDVKASSAEERKAKLQKLKAAVETHADDIVAAVLKDTRKPEGEIRVTEVMNVVGNIQLNIDSLEEWMQPTEVTPSKNP